MNILDKLSKVKLGDTIFIYLSWKQIYRIKVEYGKVFQTKYGSLKHEQLIGIKYGSKFNCSKGFIYILAFSPELWTLTLPHRTQIIYCPDISLITSQLHLRPGSIVIESGTGSGSLSHSLIRTIYPNGHLYTYDFHQERVKIAEKEFKEHGLTSLVTIQWRDVCKDGFNLTNLADAIFLDLPHPWEVIPFASKALRAKDARICCFSPCIEQVQKTYTALHKNFYIDITTVECVLRPFEIKQSSFQSIKISNEKMDTYSKIEEGFKTCKESEKETLVRVVPMINITGHTGYLTFATKL